LLQTGEALGQTEVVQQRQDRGMHCVAAEVAQKAAVPCFSRAVTATQARASSRPRTIPAGSPPTTQHVVRSIAALPFGDIPDPSHWDIYHQK
jgi:hypothetical protein